MHVMSETALKLMLTITYNSLGPHNKSMHINWCIYCTWYYVHVIHQKADKRNGEKLVTKTEHVARRGIPPDMLQFFHRPMGT